MKRRNSVWIEESTDDDINNKRSKSSESDTNANTKDSGANGSFETVAKPAKVQIRRHSERLMQKQSLSLDVKQKKSTENIDVDVVVIDDQPVNKVEATNGYQLKPRCELSIGILDRFNDILPKPTDPKSKRTKNFSALCRICGQRKQFVKGNVSNLKTHLKKVIHYTKLSLFLFVWYLIISISISISIFEIFIHS